MGSLKLSVRSRKEVIDELDHLAQIKGVDRAQLLCQFIEKGLEKEKVRTAIELYQNGDTLERACNRVDVSLWDVIEAMRQRGITTKFDFALEKLAYARAVEEFAPELAKKILELSSNQNL